MAEEQAHGTSPDAEKATQADHSVTLPLELPPPPDSGTQSPWSETVSSPFKEDTSSFPDETDNFPIPAALSTPRKSGMLEAVASPFTPDDNPVYELCADDTSPQRLGSLLGSVPEDEPACAPAVAGSSPAAADILQPGALQLPTVRTPRKPRFQSSVEVPEAEKAIMEHQLSVDFSKFGSEDLDATFNPFAGGDQSFAGLPAHLPEASGSSREESFFSMEMEGAPQGGVREIPFGVANLDFGSRDGGGVVGPKLDAVPSRQADKFEVKECEDAEIKQLLWVIENLQEELHISNRAYGVAESQQKGTQAVVDHLQRDLDEAKAQEAEVQLKLGLIHTQLEGQLLTKLEQEEEIRESGIKLKQTRAEIDALDELLAQADTLRKKLKAEAAEKRASQQNTSPENKGLSGAESSPKGSPHSNYSSAWGDTSDSDADQPCLDLDDLQESRPPTTISEDNQAKLTEKGGKGGSWLRSVLGGLSKNNDVLTPAEDASKRREVFGAAHSHFEQPSTAAELAPPPVDEEEIVPPSATAFVQPPPAAGEGDLLKDLLKQNAAQPQAE